MCSISLINIGSVYAAAAHETPEQVAYVNCIVK